MKPMTYLSKTLAAMTLALAAFVSTGAQALDLNHLLTAPIKDLVHRKSGPSAAPVSEQQAAANAQSCSVWRQFSNPVPTSPVTNALNSSNVQDLCREQYFVHFSATSKTPLYTVEIMGTKAAGHEPRTDNFQPDPNVSRSLQASLNDYRHSGFDRGHMAPAADMNTESAMSESFYLTNMVPQVGPNMNRGVWAEIESAARGIASREQSAVLIFTGPIFDSAPAAYTIGSSRVWVPNAFFKVIYRTSTGKYQAYIVPNVQVVTRKTKNLDKGNPSYPQTTPEKAINCSSSCTSESFRVDLAQVERVAGWKFFK